MAQTCELSFSVAESSVYRLLTSLPGKAGGCMLIDRAQPGREASWAAAGIIPACKFRMRGARGMDGRFQRPTAR